MPGFEDAFHPFRYIVVSFKEVDRRGLTVAKEIGKADRKRADKKGGQWSRHNIV